MGNGVIGALNDYLGRVVQVTVRNEAGDTFDSVKIELHGKLGRASDGYSVAAPDGTVIGRLIVDDSAAELVQWRDPDNDEFGNDWIGFSVGGVSITVGTS